MQLPPVPVPHDWADRFLTLLAGLVGGGTILKALQLIVNKAKRKSEVASINAKTEIDKVDAFAKYQNLLMQLQDRLNHVEATSDQREADSREVIQFLQSSITYQRQMLSAYIKRGHDFAGEVSKLTLYIANMREGLAVAIERVKRIQNDQKLPDGLASELTELVLLITPGELAFRTQEQINANTPLPNPPDGVENMEDVIQRR